MPNQIDLTPVEAPRIHAHVPNGHSASEFNNPSDASAPAQSGKATVVTVTASPGTKVPFANTSQWAGS